MPNLNFVFVSITFFNKCFNEVQNPTRKQVSEKDGKQSLDTFKLTIVQQSRSRQYPLILRSSVVQYV